MDVAQVIFAALSVDGATGADQRTTTALLALRQALRRRLGADAFPGVEDLRARLLAASESDAEDLAARARAVLALTDPDGTAAGRYADATHRVSLRAGPASADDATAAARERLALLRRTPERAAETLAVLEKVLADTEQRLGADHPDAVAARNAVQAWLRD